MPATMRDIAKRLGISVSTVSYALNGGPRPVPEEVRQRVLEVARELDYRPNRLARSMVTGRTETVAVVPPMVMRHMLQFPYIHAVLSAIADAVGEHGYDILLHTSAAPMSDVELVQFLLGGKVDGILLVAPLATSQVAEELRRRQVPCVVLSARREGLPCVCVDNEIGVFAAMDWLYAHGHRAFGFVSGPPVHYDAMQRWQAFRRYLCERELPLRRDWIVEGDFTTQRAREGVRVLLSQPQRPTAILAANDESAIGVLQAAQEVGVRVPEELSVVGFDDMPFAQLLTPRLTTIQQPIEQMAAEAVSLLMRWIKEREQPEDGVRKLPAELVLRESTAPAPGFSSSHMEEARA